MTVLICDIKKTPTNLEKLPVDFHNYDSIYAFTPYAAWLLDAHRVKYNLFYDLIPRELIFGNAENTEDLLLELFARLNPQRPDVYYGLMYNFAIIVDYCLQEWLKYDAIFRNECVILTDIDVASGQFSEHLENDSSIYLSMLDNKNIFVIDRRVEWRFHRLREKLNRGRKLGCQNFIRKVLARAQSSKVYQRSAVDQCELVLCNFHYNWLAYQRAICRRFRTESPQGFVRRVAGIGPSEGSGEQTAMALRLEQAVATTFGHWPTNIRQHCLQFFMPKFVAYEQLRLRLDTIIDDVLKREQVIASLVGFCSPEEYLLNYYLKSRGVMTISYQHGSYILQDPMIKYSEAWTATKSFVFGERDRELFDGFACGTEPVVMGANMFFHGRVSGRKPPNRAVYYLRAIQGNGWQYLGRFFNMSPDGVEDWRRHQAVLKFFAGLSDWQLTVKLHPAQRTYLGEPLAEYLRDIGAKNIRIDSSSPSSAAYFDNFRLIILDYAETTLLHALAAGHQSIICFFSRPPDADIPDYDLLKTVCPIAESTEELIQVLEPLHSNKEPPQIDKEAARLFFQKYGGHFNHSRSEDYLIGILLEQVRHHRVQQDFAIAPI